MKATLVMFVVAILARFVGIRWGDLPNGLLLAIVIGSTLVGFSERILFRGIFLRCLRSNGRAKGIAALCPAI